MSGYDREAAEAEAREAAERDRLPSEYTSQVLRATASRMQSRIDAILERDKDERVAIERRGAGISFLFARDIVHALTAGHDEIERLRAELAVLRTPATDEALVKAARPLDEWSDSDGDVLWWKFPVTEAPWVGTPNDLGYTVELHAHVGMLSRALVGGWPGYHTHWTRLPPTPEEPKSARATTTEQVAHAGGRSDG